MFVYAFAPLHPSRMGKAKKSGSKDELVAIRLNRSHLPAWLEIYRDPEVMRQMYAAPTFSTSSLWNYLQKRKFYSVLQDGAVVGGFNFYDIHDSRACFGVVTHPDFRGKGLGRKLVRLMKAEAKRLGYRTLRADIYLDNKACLALVKKTGFRQFVWVETNV